MSVSAPVTLPLDAYADRSAHPLRCHPPIFPSTVFADPAVLVASGSVFPYLRLVHQFPPLVQTPALYPHRGAVATPYSPGPMNMSWRFPLPPLSPGAIDHHSPSPISPQLDNLSSAQDPVDHVHPSLRYIKAKTVPCRHFIQSNGWCPYGERCHFIHKVSQVQRPALRCMASSSAASTTSSLSSPRSSSTITFVSSAEASNSLTSLSRTDASSATYRNETHEFCWAFVQGICKVKDCCRFHPKNIVPYMPFTPCLTYPACFGGEQCPFKHPDPPFNFRESPSETSWPSKGSVSTDLTQAQLPEGATERNGTIFFPVPLGRPSFQPGQDVADLQIIANTRYALVTPQGLEFVAPPSCLTQAEKEALTFPPSPTQYATGVISEIQSLETPKASGEFPRSSAKKSTSRNRSKVQHGRRASVAGRPESEAMSSTERAKATNGRKMRHGKNKSWAAVSAFERR